MSTKFEVWHGGEFYQSYPTKEKAIKVANVLDREPGSVWVIKVTREHVDFK